MFADINIQTIENQDLTVVGLVENVDYESSVIENLEENLLCVGNTDCPNELSCLEQKCTNPCNLNPCGINTQCQVMSHRPICSCLPGYNGDPFNTGCTLTDSGIFCFKMNIFIVQFFNLISIIYLISVQNPCSPNPCGSNAICKKHESFERVATCYCIPGYSGDPFWSCQPE